MIFLIKINSAYSFMFCYNINIFDSCVFSIVAPFQCSMRSCDRSFEPCPIVCFFLLFFSLMLFLSCACFVCFLYVCANACYEQKERSSRDVKIKIEMQEQELKTLSSFRILWKASVLDAYLLYLYNMHFNYTVYLLLALILMDPY